MNANTVNVSFKKKRYTNSADSFSQFPFDACSLASKVQKPIKAYINSTHVIVYNIYDIEFLNLNGCFGSGSLSRKEPSFHKKLYKEKSHLFARNNHRYMSKRRYDRLLYLKNNGHSCLSKEVLIEMSIKEDEDLLDLFKNVKDINIDKINLDIDSKITEFNNIKYNNEFYGILQNDNILNVDSHTDEDYKELPEIIKYDKCNLDQLSNANMNNQKISCTDYDMVIVYDKDFLPVDEKVQNIIHSRLSLKPNPFPLVEHLQLSFEEAFFLTYSFGCLQIYNLENRIIDIGEFWNTCISLRINFLPRYVVYHYYRSRGWIVKNGFKYGSDFVLYKKGPQYYHSSFSIVVCSQKLNVMNSDDETSQSSDSDDEQLEEPFNKIIDAEMSECNDYMNAINKINDTEMSECINFTNDMIVNDTDFESCASKKTIMHKNFNSQITSENIMKYNFKDNELYEKHCELFNSELTENQNSCPVEKKLKLDVLEENSLEANVQITKDTILEDPANDFLKAQHSKFLINSPVEEVLFVGNKLFNDTKINCSHILNDKVTPIITNANNLNKEPEGDKHNLYSSDYILSQLPDAYPSNWLSMSCLLRITEQVAKELLFSFVLFPENIDVSSPLSLSKFAIDELIVKRWIPQHERSQQMKQ